MKRAPKPTDRRVVRVGRASVNWGPQTYGGPTIVASAPLDAVDDLVAAVREARAAIEQEIADA